MAAYQPGLFGRKTRYGRWNLFASSERRTFFRRTGLRRESSGLGLGPGHATNVVLTHNTDPAFAVVAAVPSEGTVEQTGGLVTARFGVLAAGAAARLNVGLTPQAAGTFTNRLETTSDQGVIAAADVVVPVSAVPPRLGLSLGADTLTFTWPVSATGFVLESAGSLSPPIQWAPVTNAPVVVGDLETLRPQPTNSTAFYRLRWVP